MSDEARIESAVKTYAASKDFYVRKFSAPGRRGVPDDIFISPFGRTFFIEFKGTGGGKLSLLQKREKALIEKRGVKVYVVSRIDTGKNIIDQYSVDPLESGRLKWIVTYLRSSNMFLLATWLVHHFRPDMKVRDSARWVRELVFRKNLKGD